MLPCSFCDAPHKGSKQVPSIYKTTLNPLKLVAEFVRKVMPITKCPPIILSPLNWFNITKNGLVQILIHRHDTNIWLYTTKTIVAMDVLCSSFCLGRTCIVPKELKPHMKYLQGIYTYMVFYMVLNFGSYCVGAHINFHG